MNKDYYTLDEAALFLTEELGRKFTSDDIVRIVATRESKLDLCIYFHGALEFQLENTTKGGLWPSFYITDNFRGYIKVPVDAIHPDRNDFSPFQYARIIEELSNGLLMDPSAEKVLFPKLYARRIAPLVSSPAIPFHPQDEIVFHIISEPLSPEPTPLLFEANRNKALITKNSILNFLADNQTIQISRSIKPEIVLSLESDVKTEALLITEKGFTSQQIADVFYSFHYESKGKWRKYLGDPPEWLKKCRISKGMRGSKNKSAIWNPVEIALALLNIGISEDKLNQAFKKPLLKDWKDEWKNRTYSDL